MLQSEYFGALPRAFSPDMLAAPSHENTVRECQPASSFPVHSQTNLKAEASADYANSDRIRVALKTLVECDQKAARRARSRR
jgi:hypothetical protein